MRYLLCLVVLALVPLNEARAATVPGAAVFVRAKGAAEDARSDVYEQSLAGGPARVLVSHAALPKSLRGRIERARPSPDGSLLLLDESDGVIIRNKRTGVTRLMLLGGWHAAAFDSAKEVEVGDYVGGCWLWSRRTRAIKRLALVNPGGAAAWSPRGELVVTQDFDGRTNTLRVVNVVTGRTRTLLTTQHDVLCARWTSDGAALLVAELVGETASRLELVSLTGKTQRLFTRPVRVFNAAVSPDGRQVAVGDTSGYFLFERNGRARRKLALPEIGGTSGPFEASPRGDLAFSPDGSMLAVLVSYESGPAHLVVNEELWMVQTKTGAARRLKEWFATFARAPQNEAVGAVQFVAHRDRAPRSSAEADAPHVLLGWVPGQSAVFLLGGNGTEAAPETNRRRLWLYPMRSAQPPRLLADAGPYGLDMAWWG
jgi:hypothetical protein